MAESSFKPITSCVFPVAGLGTRFLPATRNIPKEMLPLIIGLLLNTAWRRLWPRAVLG